MLRDMWVEYEDEYGGERVEVRKWFRILDSESE
jgi:hypothetical protein